jgi:hypothetical protein
MSAVKMSAEQIEATKEATWLRGMAIKLAQRGYPPETEDQLHKAASTFERLRHGQETGQVPATKQANDIFSVGLSATEAIRSSDTEFAYKAAFDLMNDDQFLEASLAIAQSEVQNADTN